MALTTFSKLRRIPSPSAARPARPDRNVAGSHWRAVLAALGTIGFLTIAGTVVAGCGSSASSAASGGQSGNGSGGRGGTGSGGQGGVGSGGVAGSGVGGGSGGAVGGAGGGAGGGASGGAGGASAGIWTSDATQAIVEDDGGGFVGPPPAGSECGYGEAAYTFTVADDKLAWHYCNTTPATSGGPFTFVDGSRILTVDEQNMLVAALKKVVPSTNTSCGADKSQRLLTITRPGDASVYRDDFYACEHLGPYVQGIDSVFSVASNLAK